MPTEGQIMLDKLTVRGAGGGPRHHDLWAICQRPAQERSAAAKAPKPPALARSLSWIAR